MPLKIKAYKTSLGAESMHDDTSHIAERFQYNYTDIALRGESFSDAPAELMATLKHHVTMLYATRLPWEKLSEIYSEICALVRPSDPEFAHPVWPSVFRHAGLNMDAELVDGFMSGCFGVPVNSPDDVRTSLPPPLRLEWLFHHRRRAGDIISPLADAETAKDWFPAEIQQRMAILGVSAQTAQGADAAAMNHYMGLLQALSPNTYAIGPDATLPEAFMVAEYREKAYIFAGNYVAAEVWQREAWPLLLRYQEDRPRYAFLKRMKQVWKRRVSCCNTLHDWPGLEQANKDWQALLSGALQTRIGTHSL